MSRGAFLTGGALMQGMPGCPRSEAEAT